MNYTFYIRPAEAWEAMYADCAAARSSINIEQFIFEDGEMGRRFFALFQKKKEEGIAIKILCDGVGSYDLYNSTTERTLLGEGIDIRFFNPIQPWRINNISSWFLRNHRKILVVDKAIAHTGGVNIGERMGHWRDTNVRITGAVVQEIQSSFDQMWSAAPRRKFFKFKPPLIEGEGFSFLSNSPRINGRYIYHDLRHSIRKAKKYIYLTTPYFVPSIPIFRSLTKAARRGVDVRILLPGTSDVHLANIATGSYFLLALKAGIKLYLYDTTTVLHAKTAVIDDAWATVGSANIDTLSLLLNYEGSIRSYDAGFVAEVKRQFVEDLSHATAVERETWVRRPFSLKILEFITWPLHGIL